MSDNIDYAELDKAVNEAIKNRSASEAKSSAKSVARPAGASVASRSAVKPAMAMHQSHGQFMDFVRKPGTHIAHPAPIATRPVARPTGQPVATKPVARPVVHPTATKITTAPRPAIVPRSAKIGYAVKPVRPSIATQIQQKQQSVAARPVTRSVAPKPVAHTAVKPAAKPAVRPTVAKPVAHTAPKPVHTAAKPVAKPVVKPAAKPVAKPVAKAEEKPATKPAKTEKAPNANNYSLGVRSPFLLNTKVDKRPIGKDIPETSATALESTKNIYSSKSPSKVSAKKKKHMVTEAPKKHSGWLYTLVVLFVIAAGAGIGYLAYILVFAN